MKRSLLLSVHMLFMWAGPSHAQWIPQAAGQYDVYDWVNLLRIADDQHVWAGISNYNTFGGVAGHQARVARTADGGQTWQTITIPGTDGYDTWGASVLGADTAFVSLNKPQSAEDRLYQTTDGGQTWHILLQNVFAGYQVYFRDALNGLLYRGPYNTRFTTDGGLTWHEPLSMPPGLANQGIFNYPGSETEAEGNWFFAGLEDGRFLRTADAGQTWEAFPTPVSTPLSDLAFENEKIGLAAAIFQQNNGSGWLSGGPSRLFKTTDGGETWSEIPKDQLPYGATGAFINVMAATGAPGEYILEARAYEQPGLQYSTFRSADGGQSWQEISACPGEPLGVIEFDGSASGWAGNSLVQDASNEAMFFKWGQPDPPEVILTCDPGNVPVSAQGMFLACNLNNWNPAATPMNHGPGNLWTVALEVPADSVLYYYFVNGNDLSGAETVPEGCGILNNGIYTRKILPAPCRNTHAPEVLFGYCLPDGELEPHTTTVCDSSGAYLICETFDTYQGGKVGPQSAIWKSYGCNFDETEGDECDVDLHGYADGFANYSGRYAMHPNGGPAGLGNQSIELQLGDLSSGRYELAFRFYLPRNRKAFTSLFFDYSSTYSSIDLNISAKGVLDYDKYNGETFEYGPDTSFQIGFDVWHDVRFVFDLDEGRRSFWWDGMLMHTADDAQVNRLVNMGFGGGNGNDFFIDDLSLKNLLFVGAQHIYKTAPEWRISPNPAREQADIICKFTDTAPTCFTLFNQFGQEIERMEAKGAQEVRQKLDFQGVAPGLYLVRMQHADFTGWEKIVVER